MSDHHERKRGPVQDEEHDPRKRMTREQDFGSTDWQDSAVWKELDSIFFQPTDYIQADTTEYHDFKDFFQKYLQYRKFQKPKEAPKANPLGDVVQGKRLTLPSSFDSRYKVNFSLMSEEHTRRRRLLSPEALTEFRRVLHLYEDFCQRRDFSKLVKIRNDRAGLPIAQYETQIIQTLATHQVIVIAGDTGCGKSTQVPQFLLKAGYDKIACTQPRRIAAMSLCRRVSYETLNEFGSKVAYQIRFETSKSMDTKILFVTEGLLLRQVASDPLLSMYNVIIVDEVHERHIQGDFLLGILKKLLPQRRDLKVVLMSATINLELFSTSFDNAPIIRVPGRMYPIEVVYRPIAAEQNDEELFNKDKSTGKSIRSKNTKELDAKPYLRILEEIDQQVPSNERGDLLVFMSGIKEIMTLADPLKAYGKQTGRWIVLMCHSSLSVEEQEKVFDIAPDGVRKCILATNICETAVTIDGVRFVVDSGKVKEMGFDTDARMQSLQEYWVSKASSEQRKGRAGRTGPGVCYRLYSRNEYDHFLDYSPPEIKRIPLEAIVLQIKALNLGDPRAFAFVERPESEAVNTAVLNLKQHQLLNADSNETITPMGEVLSRLPVDIAIGKMLVLATIFSVVDPVLSIAAALSVQSPFVRIESAEEALSIKRRFESVHGDPFMLLNIFDEWIKVKAEGKENSRKWCKRHYLEEQRLYEMAKLKKQFREILLDSHLLSPEAAERDERMADKWTHPGGRRSEYSRRDLRRLQIMQAKQRGRRVLKFEGMQAEGAEEEEAGDEDANDAEIDIRDLDFKLSHDLQELERASSRQLSLREVNLITVILASGLYPNVAVPDDANMSRKESDAVFHTKWQRLVLLHPQGSLSGRTSTLPPTDILFYQSLLFTNKPYLVNTLLASAVHTLFLSAQNIDCSLDCSRFIVDNWIEITLNNAKSGEKLLIVVHQLRLMLRNLTKFKLTAHSSSKHFSLLEVKKQEEDPAALHQLPPWARRIMKESTDESIMCSDEILSTKLAEFLETPIPAGWQRAKQTNLPATFLLKPDVEEAVELKSFAAVQSQNESSGEDPMAQMEAEVLVDLHFEEKKDGIKLADWLRYGSVRQERSAAEGLSSHMRKHWDCGTCKGHFVFSATEIEDHRRTCTGKTLREIAPEEIRSAEQLAVKEEEPPPALTPFVVRAPYQCAACDKTFLFTPPEVLRHKRGHSAPPTDAPATT